jgi:hypothetical protein
MKVSLGYMPGLTNVKPDSTQNCRVTDAKIAQYMTLSRLTTCTRHKEKKEDINS